MKPTCKLVGENGNIFNLVGIASRALEEINDKMPERERLTREQLDEVVKAASEE